MKKKALTVILPLCIVMTMTACGGNVETAEVEETTVTEESTEADVQAEAEAGEQAQEEAEEQAGIAEADMFYEAGRKSLYGLDGAQINIEDAYTNFTKAQELGNTDANFYLGILADSYYSYPELDFEQAKVYYEQCGDSPYAQIALGWLYYFGRGVEQDMEKGKGLFQSMADQGVVEGYDGLAWVARGEGDSETALEYYNKVVDEGTEQIFITSAMNNLGNMYQNGSGVEQNGEKAVEWYTKAADLGNTSAMSNLGFMYQNGDGVEQKGEKAIEWYTKAIDAGDTSGFFGIGNMYQYGNGVEQDGEKAIEWYTKAMDLGDTSAMISIGSMYQNGSGVEQDGEKAIEWYTKAADLGDTSAMSWIGDVYWNGDGVEQDGEKAIEWYTKAADAGDGYGFYRIGLMYEWGDGVEKDIDKAIEYYTKGADLGDTRSKIALKDLQAQ